MRKCILNEKPELQKLTDIQNKINEIKKREGNEQ